MQATGPGRCVAIADRCRTSLHHHFLSPPPPLPPHLSLPPPLPSPSPQPLLTFLAGLLVGLVAAALALPSLSRRPLVASALYKRNPVARLLARLLFDDLSSSSSSPTSSSASSSPRVTLVGAGPGSPDLLTLAAHNALRAADVVICDKIASPALKALVPPHAEYREADKIPGKADAAQDEVNAWGVEALRAGKRVVRLKVGDPYLYGRGGEEVLFYRRHGFTAAVLPGVTSALVAPLAAGIPVTHRGYANQLLITTGQGRGGSVPDLPPYDSNRTLVMLMGVGRIPTLREDLVGGKGYPDDTPVAIIERSTHEDERVTRTTLARVKEDAAAAGVQSPAVLVLGNVVNALLEGEGEGKGEGGDRLAGLLGAGVLPAPAMKPSGAAEVRGVKVDE
jgi:uroporphyrin-III C-methyltransferase